MTASYLIPLPLEIKGVNAWLISNQEQVLLQLRKGRVYDQHADAEMELELFPGVRQTSFHNDNGFLVDIEIDDPASVDTLRRIAMRLAELGDDYEADRRLGRPNP